MLLALFLLFSLPIGCFAVWFGWKAYQVEKRSVAFAMAWIAFFCFASALLVGSWSYLFITA